MSDTNPSPLASEATSETGPAPTAALPPLPWSATAPGWGDLTAKPEDALPESGQLTDTGLLQTLRQDPEGLTAQPRLDLASLLHAARKARGWSQAELARRAGIAQHWIAKIETGDLDVRLSTLVKVAEALGARLEVRLVAGCPLGEGK